ITDEIDDEIVIRVFATETDRNDCGLMTNTAEVDASNLREMLELLGVEEPRDVLESTATITVWCPVIELEKENDAVGSVVPGTEVTYTLTLTVDDETESATDSEAEDVVVVDLMPVGLENPTDISNGGTFNAATRTITWNLGDLAHGEYTLTYNAIVADDVENGEELVNAAAATSPNSQCPDLETLGPECDDTSTVIPRVPTLVIDKVANAEVITMSGPASAPVATPSVVTWTLSYTLANGPVTNAVITDVVPTGFTFLDAANGGTLVGGTTVTWNLGELTTSGSVSFRTTVNVATISRVAPTVNVAVIDSDQTPPDEGQDSVRVVVEPPPQGGTPTPRPSLPNTATATGIDGQPVTVPIELLVVFFLGSLGALAFANVRSSRRR
ncbi:MAG TPA: Ig-like domain-containing protein, partial [Actinomycetota bacterium]|nr:Ig-like domain-containing protein [Actinomycetota bacterium]